MNFADKSYTFWPLCAKYNVSIDHADSSHLGAQNMEFMFEWEADGDRFSFEDSDRFEDDSLCSWISEPESLCNNWRGWRKPICGTGGGAAGTGSAPPPPSSSAQAHTSSRDRASGTACSDYMGSRGGHI